MCMMFILIISTNLSVEIWYYICESMSAMEWDMACVVWFSIGYKLRGMFWKQKI